MLVHYAINNNSMYLEDKRLSVLREHEKFKVMGVVFFITLRMACDLRASNIVAQVFQLST